MYKINSVCIILLKAVKSAHTQWHFLEQYILNFNKYKYIKLIKVICTMYICNSYSIIIKCTFSAEESAYREKTIVKVKIKACL